MKRNMDLIRELLLKLEPERLDGDLYRIEVAQLGIEGYSYADLSYHMLLLIEGGLFLGERDASGGFVGRMITPAGHDFLDSVRDQAVWSKTKKGALEAGGFTIDLLKDLAKGFLKTQIEERTGVKL
jgi:hypothetical protein